MIGQAWSASLNAGMVRLVGGPYDGQSGLYDHNAFDAIAFCDAQQKVTHEYLPADKRRSWDYVFSRSYKW